MEQKSVYASEKKPICFSGIQPTGTFTLGNYLGAVRNWVDLQKDYRCVYSIVDLHAITVRQDPKILKQNTLAAYALVMACGINPEQSILFVQSQVKTHAELTWALSCFTQFGELSRMTQFKDKSTRYQDNINAGLFTYPILQAADILLYQADVVPIGADQKQHLELARDIANRFNGVFGQTFKLPEHYIPKEGARIMSLQDPTKKMSKSDGNPRAYISILDEPGTIVKKCKGAVTDSGSEVVYREGKDGINNLMTIYSICAGKSYDDIAQEFEGHGYGTFKQAVGECVAEAFRPIREKFAAYMADKAYLEDCYRKGAEKALCISQRTVNKAYQRLGFLK